MDKEREKQLCKVCTMLIKFADEILPQAGGLSFNIGNLNDALVLAADLGVRNIDS